MTFSPGFPSAHPGQLNRKAHRSPLHRHTRDASTPAQGATLRFGSGGATPEVAFRPCGFTPLRRLPPHRGPQACCILQPVLGFATFPPYLSAADRRSAGGGLPRRAGRTPRRNPRATAVPRHRGRCPLAVGTCAPSTLAPPRCRSGVYVDGGRRTSTSRPCSVVGSRRDPHRCRCGRDRSFLGFYPLQGPSRRPEIPSPTVTWAGAPREERIDRKLRSPPVDARGRGQERAGRDARRTARQGATRPGGPSPGAGSDRDARGRSGEHSTVHRRRPKPPSAPRIGTRAPKRARGTRLGRNPFESSQRGECTARRGRSRSCLPARQKTESKLAVRGHLCRRSLSGVEVREGRRGLSSSCPLVRRRVPR